MGSATRLNTQNQILFLLILIFTRVPFSYSQQKTVPLSEPIEGPELPWWEPPIMAVNSSSDVIVVWSAPVTMNGPFVSEMALIPSKLTFPLSNEKSSISPIVTFRKENQWRDGGLLMKENGECNPLFAWYSNMDLHLLFTNTKRTLCKYIFYEAKKKEWRHVNNLPFVPHPHLIHRRDKVIHLAKDLDDRLEYCVIDGETVSKKRTIQLKNARYPCQIRMMGDSRNHVHIIYANMRSKKNAMDHGHIEIEKNTVTDHSEKIRSLSLQRDQFGLGVDPDGNIVIVYQPDPESSKKKPITLSRFVKNEWSKPEILDDQVGDIVSEYILLSHQKNMIVSWVVREDLEISDFMISTSVRRITEWDGKKWSKSHWCVFRSNMDGVLIPESASTARAKVDREGIIHMVWDYSYCRIEGLK